MTKMKRRKRKEWVNNAISSQKGTHNTGLLIRVRRVAAWEVGIIGSQRNRETDRGLQHGVGWGQITR